MPVPVGGVGGLPVPPHTRRRCACIAGGTATPPRQRLCGKQVPECGRAYADWIRVVEAVADVSSAG